MNDVTVTLTINGDSREVRTDVRTTLLDLLRERLHMTGAKKGCDHGLCGACKVAVNDERVVACLTLAASIDGAEVVTVEGIADGDELHPIQRAFIEHDGFQCGYCTSGQISSAYAMLREHARGDLSTESFKAGCEAVCSGPVALTHSEISERMAGNICRCGAYANIVAAISAVAEETR